MPRCERHALESQLVSFSLSSNFRPKLFVDACEGSGTSGDVCREMGIEYVGLDLYKGNDFTKENGSFQAQRN